MKQAQWVSTVDHLMKRDWCIDAVDAGLSEEDLARHWRDGDEPAMFVAWFAKKYDLIRHEPSRLRMRLSSSRPLA